MHGTPPQSTPTPGVTIRPLTGQDLTAAAALAEFAFQFQYSEPERAGRERGLASGHELGVFEDGRLLASLVINPFMVSLAGGFVSCGGLGLVASWPEARRQGHVGRLLSESLRVMRARGQVLSMLYPFKAAFYRRYGWEAAGYVDQARIAPSDLNGFVRRGHGVSPFRRLPEHGAQWRELEPDYERLMERYNGLARREPTRWTEVLLTAGREAVAWPGHGYIVYSVKGNEARIHELVALDLEAEVSAYAHLAQLDSMAKTISLDLPPDSLFTWLEGAPGVSVTRTPTIMIRVVDLAALVETYKFTQGQEERFTLCVHDEHAPWNAGNWSLTVDCDGNGRLEPKADAGEPDLTLGIQALAAAMVGAAPLSALVAAGRAFGLSEAAERMSRRLDRRPPYSLDFF